MIARTLFAAALATGSGSEGARPPADRRVGASGLRLVRRGALLLAASVLGAALSASAAWAAEVRLIAERITPQGSGDLALISYPSVSDLLNGTNLGVANLPLGNGDFSPAFDIAGFTAVGSGFMLIAERVTP
jgi:hypothetical protein